MVLMESALMEVELMGMEEVVIAGPFFVVASQAQAPGSIGAQSHTPGSVAKQSYVPGSISAQAKQ